MPYNPEHHRPKEQERRPYYLASRFPTKQAAEQPYFAVQETIHTVDCDVSAYRFQRQWEEPNEKPWYVLVIGEKPEPAVEERLTTALSQGELATVPQEALERLMDRRQEQQQYGSHIIPSKDKEYAIQKSNSEESQKAKGIVIGNTSLLPLLIS